MKESKLVIAPGIPVSEIMALRAHIDEAISDPDYSVVISYECIWMEGFGSYFGISSNFPAFKT